MQMITKDKKFTKPGFPIPIVRIYTLHIYITDEHIKQVEMHSL